jgi:hypothetical protein
MADRTIALPFFTGLEAAHQRQVVAALIAEIGRAVDHPLEAG